ncbi:MAG: MBL fold metallo-hydrolase, partial [Candidatus Bathyarchaeia archaeon]
MTRGTTQKRGTLAAANSVLNGNPTCEASVSKYHQKMPQQTIVATPGTTFQTGSITITATKAQHTDPDAVGFRFHTAEFGEFAYTSDTEYYANIGEQYKNVRLLILCVMRPRGKPWTGHMTTEDAIKIIKETKPETAIITHFGMRMILEDPKKEAKKITQETGTPVIAAVDGMRVVFGEQIRTEKPTSKNQANLNMFLKR